MIGPISVLADEGMYFRLVLLLGLAWIGIIAPLQAEVLTLDDANCSVEYPSDWKAQTTDSSQHVITSGNKAFIIGTAPARSLLSVDMHSVYSGTDDRLVGQGYSIQKTDYVTFKDLRFRVVDFSKEKNGVTTYGRSMMVLADGHIYGINLFKLGAPPTDDAELTGILNSFKFLHPPHEQTSDMSLSDIGYMFEGPPDDGGIGHQIMYRLGSLKLFIKKWIFPVLGLVLVAVVAIAVVAIRFVRSKMDTSR